MTAKGCCKSLALFLTTFMLLKNHLDNVLKWRDILTFTGSQRNAVPVITKYLWHVVQVKQGWRLSTNQIKSFTHVKRLISIGLNKRPEMFSNHVYKIFFLMKPLIENTKTKTILINVCSAFPWSLQLPHFVLIHRFSGTAELEWWRVPTSTS